MHTEEGAERGVDAGYFHRDQAEQLLASPGAAVAFVAQAAELQFLEGWQQLERERILGPVLVDDRLDLGLHVGANLPDDRPFIGGQHVHELVEVAMGAGSCFGAFFAAAATAGAAAMPLLLSIRECVGFFLRMNIVMPAVGAIP